METQKRAQKGKQLLLLLLLLAVLMVSARAEGNNYVKIMLRQQGGTGGTSELYVKTEERMPNIDLPTRRGYDFLGYYTEPNGKGTQYYATDGTTAQNCGFTETAALYAAWGIQTYQITYSNMEQAALGVLHPISHTYGKATTIADPTRAGYTFFGWKVDNSLIANQGLVLGATAYTKDIVLTAVWNRAHITTAVYNTTDNVSIRTEDLQEVFQRQVSDPAVGVTADDLNSDEVTLTMIASDADLQADGAEDIIGLAQGEALKFYDFTVKKEVTSNPGDTPTVSVLHTLPNTVQVDITLNQTLTGRSGYRVYRYHNGTAEAIPTGPVEADYDQTQEYFTIKNGHLMIYTRRLSTYAVVGNSRSFSETENVLQDSNEMDVQTRIRSITNGPVYQLDILWGEMQFQYSTAREWDPDHHCYTNVRTFDWVSSGFDGRNNQISIANHSNGDVAVDFLLTSQTIDGVDMTLHTANSTEAPIAEDVYLSKVPMERDEAPTVQAYLWLRGSPADTSFYDPEQTNERGYIQVADIAVTIAYMEGTLTPVL